MKTRLTIALLALLAFACMAPTCTGAEQNAGAGSDYAQKLTAVLCTSDGFPIGTGYAFAGDHMFSCEVKVYDATCNCPDLLDDRTALLDIPGTALSPAAAAIVCWGEITKNPDESLYLIERICTDLGTYQPGPEGPQSVDPNNGA